MPLLPTATENAMVQAGIVPATTYFMSLHSGSPGSTGANEISGGSYARIALIFSAPTLGVMTSTDAQNFTNLPAEVGGIPFFGIWSAITGGTYLGGGTTVGASGSIGAGSGFNFAIGAVTALVA